MHPVQAHILSQLSGQSRCHYADLKPDGIESNLFAYHLRQLAKKRYIAKLDSGYELTSAGRQYVDEHGIKPTWRLLRPEVMVMVACRNSVGEWLFQWSQSRVGPASANFLSGGVYVDEKIAEAAMRRLHEVGLECRLEHRGNGYIVIKRDGRVANEIVFHLFYGAYPEGQLGANGEESGTFWAPASAIDDSYLPSVRAVLNLMRENEQCFFAELSYDL